MPKKETANRFRAIIAAIVITVSINYAISYVANASPRSEGSEITAERSGTSPVPNPPRPSQMRSGTSPVPNPPRP